MSEKYLIPRDPDWVLPGQDEVRVYGDVSKREPFYSDSLPGTICFSPKGIFVNFWTGVAYASAHGSGNRKSRVTKPTGKKTPPKFDEYYLMADALWDAADEPLSASAPNAEALKSYMMAWEIRDYAWEMLYAAFTGNAEPLRRMADAIEMAKKIREGGEQFTPFKSWEEIAEAIKIASGKAGKPPTRQAIEKELLILNPNACKGDALLANLGRMGFGWLAQAPSRPPKPKDEKTKKRGVNRNESQGTKPV